MIIICANTTSSTIINYLFGSGSKNSSIMAESQAVAKQALEKLEDQLTCAICLDTFKDPKMLNCFHVFCKDCLQRLVVTDKQGQFSLCCPTCRQSTLHGSLKRRHVQTRASKESDPFLLQTQRSRAAALLRNM